MNTNGDQQQNLRDVISREKGRANKSFLCFDLVSTQRGTFRELGRNSYLASTIGQSKDLSFLNFNQAR